ncbi:putative PTH11-like integral membrane protein [Aspergillus lucknowensis]|uniref:Rhodopsin domain-containing protein n=1 Tax=Aspergillus lucknowensis TaxID=176173 RepID=A0ABR4M2R1_9EURO
MVDQGAAICGVGAAFLALSSIAVIVRCYVRLRIVKAFGWDDSVMVLAMLFYGMLCGCMIGGGIWGSGRHHSELTPEQQSMAMEYWLLCDVAYVVSSILAKISVCIFLLRVTLSASHRATLYSVTALVVITGIIFFIFLVIQCSPVSFFWTRFSGDTSGKCGYIDAIVIMLYIFSVTSAIFDLTVGLLPIFLVRMLRAHWRTKAAVAGLLGMACIASIAVIIRIPFVQTIRDQDFLYATVQVAIWSAIEVGLSITAGSLATTRPLFQILHSHFTSTGQSNRNRKPKPSSKYKKEQHALATFDSGLRLGFDSRVGRNSSVSSARPWTGTGTGKSRSSKSIDKERGPAAEFLEPYLGTMTIRSTVEAGCGDEFGHLTLDIGGGGGDEEPNTEGVRTEDDNGAGGRGGHKLTVPYAAANSGSGISVRRTFEVSSEATGSGKQI